jgi:hypothetical protein
LTSTSRGQGDSLVDETAPLELARRSPTPQRPDGRWLRPSADGIDLINLALVRISRYRYRGNTIPNPWSLAHHA